MGPVPRQNPAFMPCVFAILDNRIAWAGVYAAQMEEMSTLWEENMMMLKYFGDVIADDDEEYVASRNKGRGSRGGRGRGRGRAGNWGFTDDEVQELLCQGIEPWDEDARVSVFGLSASRYFLTFVLGCPLRTLLTLTRN
jgi:hypothetical protein